jgi:hypothetical protein
VDFFSDFILFQYDALLFRNVNLTPEQQYALTKVAVTISLDGKYKRLRPSCHIPQAFDPTSGSYGHGNNKTEKTNKTILHPYLKTIPRVPQVQLIGNGTVYNHEGIETAVLKHPSHPTFHKKPVSSADEAAGITRFYRWHMD